MYASEKSDLGERAPRNPISDTVATTKQSEILDEILAIRSLGDVFSDRFRDHNTRKYLHDAIVPVV